LIVVDASAMAAALAMDDPQGAAARARIAGDADQHAPDLVDLEVVSVIRRLLRGDVIGAAQAEQAVEDLAGHPLVRHPHLLLLPRIWELRDNLTPYDAAYVALAEMLGATLVTIDGRLGRAPGPRCAVEVLA
jgi:predicted nucleic acid-binding protein